MRPHAIHRQIRQAMTARERLELRPDFFLEPDFLTHRIRHDQDVGEQDRGVEPEASHRLQRHLGRERG